MKVNITYVLFWSGTACFSRHLSITFNLWLRIIIYINIIFTKLIIMEPWNSHTDLCPSGNAVQVPFNNLNQCFLVNARRQMWPYLIKTYIIDPHKADLLSIVSWEWRLKCQGKPPGLWGIGSFAQGQFSSWMLVLQLKVVLLRHATAPIRTQSCYISRLLK